MCPFSALTLKKNGEIMKLEDIPIIKEKAVPKLVFESKKVKNSEGIERVAKQYVKASVSVSTEECAGGCASCATVCPTGAIVVAAKPEKGWETSAKIEVADENLCIGCGACDSVCPTGAVHLKIEEVKYSGPYNEIYWDPLIERLKDLRWSQKEEVKK